MKELIYSFGTFYVFIAVIYAQSIDKYVLDDDDQKTITTPKPSFLLEGSFYTKVDHFRPQDHRKAKFYYKLNLSYYRAGGPLFIFMNDAYSENNDQWIEHGLMVDIAQEVGGALLTFDHRYTGRNLPTNSASFDDLEYLTVEQSLADVATFIVTVKQHLGTTSPKVYVWGSGYGGSLAIWSKNKYPQLIDGAWSSSGVFYSVPISTNYISYLMFYILQYGGGDCYQDMIGIFDYFEFLLEHEDGEHLQFQFDLCEPVNTTSIYDKGLFFQLQLEFISNYMTENHIFGIQNFCRDLRALLFDPFLSYVRWVKFRYGSNINTCRDLNYDNHILLNGQTEWYQPGTNSGSRQRYYRQCTQIGLFHESSDFNVFINEIPAKYFIETCNRIFGENYTFTRLQQAIDNFIIMHGSLYMPTNKMIFTNGDLDPLRDRGITSLWDPTDSFVINILYMSRSSDLDSITGWNPQVVVNAKQRIREIFFNWINE